MASAINSHHNWKLAMDGSKDLARGPGSPFPGFSARFLGLLGFLLVVPAPAARLAALGSS